MPNNPSLLHFSGKSVWPWLRSHPLLDRTPGRAPTVPSTPSPSPLPFPVAPANPQPSPCIFSPSQPKRGSKFAALLLCLCRSCASPGAGCSCSLICSKFLHVINWPRLQLGSAEMCQRGNNKCGGGSRETLQHWDEGAIVADEVQEGTWALPFCPISGISPWCSPLGMHHVLAACIQTQLCSQPPCAGCLHLTPGHRCSRRW